jgi:hypothetical protein
VSVNGNGLPPGLSEQEAADLTEEANAWHSLLGGVRATPPTFVLRSHDVIVEGERKTMVRMMIGTVTGAFVVDLPPAAADDLAVALKAFSMRARTGLVTP